MTTKCGNTTCRAFDLNEDNFCMGRDDIENCLNFEELEPEICSHCDGSEMGKSMPVCPVCKGN